jgi:hypothetical protein
MGILGKKRRMRWAGQAVLVLLVFAAAPSWASDYWTRPCEGDLSEVARSVANRFELYRHLPLDQRVLLIRSFF